MSVPMRAVMYFVVLVLVPSAILRAYYPDQNILPYMLLLLSSVGVVFYLERRASVREYNMLLQDAHAFGAVVKQYWQDEPILATALWKKVHPDCPPPWHRQPSEDDDE